MRTHRFYKDSRSASRSAEQQGILAIDEANFIFSRFENITVQTSDQLTGTSLTVINPYVEVDATTETDPIGQNDQGVTALKLFREELKYRRLKLIKEVKSDTENTGKYKSFTLILGYDKDENDKYKLLYLDFYYWKDSEEIKEKVRIRVEQSTANAPAYTIKYLDIDSDITEYVFRLTDGLDWNKRTYMLLDFNSNQCVDKGVYIILNAPFNNNIGWIDNNRKLLQSYFISDDSDWTEIKQLPSYGGNGNGSSRA